VLERFAQAADLDYCARTGQHPHHQLLADKIRVPREKVHHHRSKEGNTSAASVPWRSTPPCRARSSRIIGLLQGSAADDLGIGAAAFLRQRQPERRLQFSRRPSRWGGIDLGEPVLADTASDRCRVRLTQ